MNGIWDKLLDQIKTQLSKPTYEMWFKNTSILEERDNMIVVGVPSEFAKDWINSRYTSLLNSTLKSITDTEISVDFVVIEKKKSENFQEEKKTQQRSRHFLETLPLNDRYNFENFVVGDSNKLAYSASKAITENPGNIYNPLFIYGDVGLGKTHLLQGIAQKVLEKNNSGKIIYTTSEKFTNEVINAIQEKKMKEFHDFYRNIEFLIIDDIQFLAGKERTQEEFFHTFNVLYDSKKQIALSSDKPPKDLSDIADRLKSRFQMGLLVDIQAPDYETRIAILRKKAEIENLDVQDEVLNFIANQPFTNIRELEGTLIRLLAYASLNNKEITIDLTRDVLKDIVNISNKVITVDEIKKIVSNYFNISPQDFETKRRDQSINTPRQIAIYLTRILTDYSLPMIGKFFGGRDHSTIIHSFDKIKREMEVSETLKVAIEEITNKLRFM